MKANSMMKDDDWYYAMINGMIIWLMTEMINVMTLDVDTDDDLGLAGTSIELIITK